MTAGEADRILGRIRSAAELDWRAELAKKTEAERDGMHAFAEEFAAVAKSR